MVTKGDPSILRRDITARGFEKRNYFLREREILHISTESVTSYSLNECWMFPDEKTDGIVIRISLAINMCTCVGVIG